MELTIDNREPETIKSYFKEKKYDWAKFENLLIGDYVFKYNNELVVIIERKTVEDLAASINDGRYREQKLRLLKNYPLNKILYIIEADLTQDNKSIKYNKVKKSTIYSSIINMYLRDNLNVYHCKNKEETLEFLETLALKIKKQGLKFTMGAAVQSVSTKNKTATVTYVKRKKGTEHQVDADVVLVATGRKPYAAGLGLEALGIEMTKSGQIQTDANYATSALGVYAIGDAIEGPMLAHKAEDEGMAIAEILAGKAGHVNYNVIPGVIYTHPEGSSVGNTEDQLKEQGRDYKVGKFSFVGNGRAKANFASEGFVKILADKNTDRILGAHIIGPMAGDLIHEICVAMEFGAAAEDLARTCHAHPTYSEAVREAALACGNGAIHS